MKKYFEVRIVETLARTIVMEAETEEEAVDLVTEQYEYADIVLDYDDFSDKEIYSNGEMDEETAKFYLDVQ